MDDLFKWMNQKFEYNAMETDIIIIIMTRNLYTGPWQILTPSKKKHHFLWAGFKTVSK